MKRFGIPLSCLAFLGTLSGIHQPPIDELANEQHVDLGDGWWKELADKDAAVAYKAIIKMVADPQKSVPYLREKLLAEPMPSAKEIADLIADLDSSTFAKRDAASRALVKMGESAEWALIRRLGEKISPEMRQRMEQILQKLDMRKASVIELRIGRALEVLERIRSVEAKNALRVLAKERPETLVAQEALLGLSRLEKHPNLPRGRASETVREPDEKTIAFTGRKFRWRYGAISPDGRRALVSEEYDRIFLWDLATGKVQREIPCNDLRGAIAWSPDGKYAATARGSGQIDIWDTRTWEVHRTLTGHPSDTADRLFPHDAKAYHLSFSADGTSLVSGGRDNSICYWNIDKGELIRRTSLPNLSAANISAVSSDGQLVAFHRAGPYRYRSDVVILDAIRNKELLIFGGQEHGVLTGSFSRTGRFFLAGQELRPSLWEVRSAQPVLTCGTGADYVSDVAMSPSSQCALSFSSLHIGRNKVWDLSSGEIIQDFKYPRSYFGAYELILYSPDGKHALAVDEKNSLTYWDLMKNEGPRILSVPMARARRSFALPIVFQTSDKVPRIAPNTRKTPHVFSISLPDDLNSITLASDPGLVALSADAKWLIQRRTSDLQLVDLESGKAVWTTPPILHSESILSLVISANGSLAISAGTVGRLWDLKSKRLAVNLVGHHGVIRSAAFSHDGTYAATRADDKTVKLWRMPHGEFFRSFDDPGGPFADVAFSLDNQLVISRGAFITSWSINTGIQIESKRRPAPEIRDFAYSKDCTIGLSGIMNDSLTLWNLRTGLQIGKLKATSDGPTPVRSIVLSPNGRTAFIISRGEYGRQPTSGRFSVFDTATGKQINYQRETIRSPKH